MKLGDTFSTRSRPLPDVYTYDVPPALRAQMTHIWAEHLPADAEAMTIGVSWRDVWQTIEREIAKAHGLLALKGKGKFSHAYHRCREHFLSADTDFAIDLIEMTCKVLDKEIRRLGSVKRVTEALAEVNSMFQKNGVGYRYESGMIIRIDSTFAHEVMVRPALALLHDEKFAGAEKEILDAHKAYREGRVDDAMTDATKAVESTIKTIAQRRGLESSLPSKQDLQGLIQFLMTKEIVPRWIQSHVDGLRNVLQGVAAPRNQGAHGDGAEISDVPPHYAAYALHLAASNIVFLVECHKALK